MCFLLHCSTEARHGALKVISICVKLSETVYCNQHPVFIVQKQKHIFMSIYLFLLCNPAHLHLSVSVFILLFSPPIPFSFSWLSFSSTLPKVAQFPFGSATGHWVTALAWFSHYSLYWTPHQVNQGEQLWRCLAEQSPHQLSVAWLWSYRWACNLWSGSRRDGWGWRYIATWGGWQSEHNGHCSMRLSDSLWLKLEDGGMAVHKHRFLQMLQGSFTWLSDDKTRNKKVPTLTTACLNV